MSRLKIDIEHIEERIFDYHEGNLTETEKAELLNLIHLHPEYESDFALWAQSYVREESSVPDYGLTPSLLQTPATAWNSAWVRAGFATGILIIGLISFLYLNKRTETVLPGKNPAKVNTSSTGSAARSIVTASSSNTASQKTAASKKNLSEQHTDLISPAQHTEEIVQQQTSDSSAVSAAQFSLQPSAEEVRQDTQSVQQKAGSTSIKKTAHKRRAPLTIKPSGNFIPTNPNF